MQSTVTLTEEDFEFDCPNKFYILSSVPGTFRTKEQQDEIDELWFTVSHELPEVIGKERVASSSISKRRSSAGRLLSCRLDSSDPFEKFDKKYGGDKENIQNIRSTSTKRNTMLKDGNGSTTDRSVSSSKKRPASAMIAPSTCNTPAVRSNSVERRPLKVARVANSGSGQISTVTTGRTKTPSRLLGSSTRPVSAMSEKRSISCGSTNRRTTSTNSGASKEEIHTSLSAAASSSSATQKRIAARTAAANTSASSSELKSKLSEVKAKINSHHSSKTNSTTATDKSLEMLLKQHNARFAPTPAYEPPRHSVRDVRRWEKISGKTWNELKPEDREKANEEISKMKATGNLKSDFIEC